MKRSISLFLALLMLLTLAVPSAQAAVTPTPPDWVTNKDEYLIIEGDEAYESENWENILRVRAHAAAGNLEPLSGEEMYLEWNLSDSPNASPIQKFEMGLAGMKYAENAENHRMATRARRYFSLARDELLDRGGSRTSKEYYLLTLWYYRARLLECIPGTSQQFNGLALQEFLTASGYTMEQFRSYPGLSVVTAEEWAAIDTRTEEQKAAAELEKTKANVTLDGVRIDTENLSRVVNGRTMIPARDVSELFGQSIVWVPEGRIAAVTENKALAGDTNLEAWALAMGAYLNETNGSTDIFGGRARGDSMGKDAIGQPSAIGFIYTYDQPRYILKNAEGMDKYMFPYTKQLGERWGDKGITSVSAESLLEDALEKILASEQG